MVQTPFSSVLPLKCLNKMMKIVCYNVLIMDIQVQELIDKIKTDGIESASEETAHIKQDAENKGYLLCFL